MEDGEQENTDKKKKVKRHRQGRDPSTLEINSQREDRRTFEEKQPGSGHQGL